MAASNIRFDPETDEPTIQRLTELCEEWGASTNEAVRRCVRTVHTILEHQKRGGRVVFIMERADGATEERGIWFV